MESMYDDGNMCEFVGQHLERVDYPQSGYRCGLCGYEIMKKKSMGNAKGAMTAHLKKHYKTDILHQGIF